MQEPSIKFYDSEEVCEILQTATVCLEQFSGRSGCTNHIPSTGQLLVTGDLHNNHTHLSKIIKLANLDIPTNHVVLQELIHSGGNTEEVDSSYQMLVRVASLVNAYPAQVHPILANHELSQVTGMEITKGSGELVERFTRSVQHVFGNKSGDVLNALNKFIMKMPLAVRSKSGVMCLHSLPDSYVMDQFDMTVLARKLLPLDLMSGVGSAHLMVWGRQHTPEQIEKLAEFWGVRLFCLGHAWVSEGIEMAMPKVLLINSDHGNGAVLPIQLDNIQSAGHTMQSAIKLSSVSINKIELKDVT